MRKKVKEKGWGEGGGGRKGNCFFFLPGCLGSHVTSSGIKVQLLLSC